MFQPEDLARLLSSINANYHFEFQRGPNYAAYSKLRESKLVLRKLEQQRMDDALSELNPILSPAPTPREKTKTPKRKLVSSPLVMSSVPNFSSVMRKEKENKRPAPVLFRAGSRMSPKASPLPPRAPTAMKVPSPKLGSKSTGAKTTRRSFSCLKEMKGFEVAGRNGMQMRNGKMIGAAESTGAGFSRYGN